jgi:hypothetical protein
MASAVKSGFAWGAALRWLIWGGAAFLLLLPLLAMQFTEEVKWGPEDFIIMGTLLAACAGIVDRATRLTNNLAYLAGAAVAAGTSFLLIWVNLAVGIIGDGPANLMFFGVILIAAAAAVAARFTPRGMAKAMLAAAGAEVLVAVVTLVTGWGFDQPPGAYRLVGGILVLALPWLLAAGLFRAAARVATEKDVPAA